MSHKSWCQISTWTSPLLLLLPTAVPSTVETHTEKPLRSMGAALPGSAITTQYSTVEFMPSMTARFLGTSIQILTPVQ